MEELLKPFFYVSDVTDRIDVLIEMAAHTRVREQKKEYLKEAQGLADAYQREATANGNDKKLFNQIYIP